MKQPVRTKSAMLLGNGLIAHVLTFQTFQKKHGKPPQSRHLMYTQLVERTGAKLALIGIGQFLDEAMAAIHAPDAPEQIRGLTLFVTDKSGSITTAATIGSTMRRKARCCIARLCWSSTGRRSPSPRQFWNSAPYPRGPFQNPFIQPFCGPTSKNLAAYGRSHATRTNAERSYLDALRPPRQHGFLTPPPPQCSSIRTPFRLNDDFGRSSVNLGHVDKWRSRSRMEAMSMKPRKLSAVLS